MVSVGVVCGCSVFSQGVSVVSWDVVCVDIVRVWMWSLDVVDVGMVIQGVDKVYGCGQWV